VGGAAILDLTDFNWELTEKLDFEFQYNTTIGLDKDLGVNQHALATLSFDVWKDFDFDVSLTWNRVGDAHRTAGRRRVRRRRCEAAQNNNLPLLHLFFRPSLALPQSRNPQRRPATLPVSLNRSRPNPT
jgi:hypothetical protein